MQHIRGQYMYKTSLKNCDIDDALKTELTYLEKLNPCQQNYYKDHLAFLVQYKQTVDVFNFMQKLTFRIPLKIIGKPYSVSEKGYVGDKDAVGILVKSMKGLNIILNGDEGLELPYVYTLSSHRFYNRFKTFDDYLDSLRSHYRYRIKKALRNSSEIAMIGMNQEEFTKEHYDLYLEVYENSKDKLECLSLTFFRDFPSELYEFRHGLTGELLGFFQLVQSNDKLTFLFGGFKQEQNRSYDLYMSMLIHIIRIGIDRGVDLIEFGQTAEETKLKLGCVAVKKYLYVHHSNKVLHFLVSKILPLLSYKPHGITYNVFKDEL